MAQGRHHFNMNLSWYIFLAVLVPLTMSARASEVTLESDFYAEDDVTTIFSVVDDGASGASTSSPVEVYFPMQTVAGGAVKGGAAGPELKASYYTQIPFIGSATADVFSGAGSKPCLVIEVANANTDADYSKLYFTIKQSSGDSYDPIQFSTTSCADAYAPATASDYQVVAIGTSTTIYVPWKEIVNSYGNISDWDVNADVEETYTAYIFVGKDPYTTVDSGNLDESKYDGGLYLKLNFSAKEPTDQATLYSLKKGDTQLTLDYDVSDATSNDLERVLIISATDSVNGGTSWKDFLTSPGGTILDSTDATETGKFTIANLTNEKSYFITATAMDRYYYVSPLPASLTQTPQELKAFIQEKSCFLLSAGFQTDSFVIDYFRAFRDQTLVNFRIGRAFIKWYYKTAPQYTDVIIKHEWLASAVRGFGYTAYAIVKYFWLWMALALASFLVRRHVVGVISRASLAIKMARNRLRLRR